MSRRKLKRLAWWERSRANALGPRPEKVTQSEYACYLRGRAEALMEVAK